MSLLFVACLHIYFLWFFFLCADFLNYIHFRVFFYDKNPRYFLFATWKLSTRVFKNLIGILWNELEENFNSGNLNNAKNLWQDEWLHAHNTFLLRNESNRNHLMIISRKNKLTWSKTIDKLRQGFLNYMTRAHIVFRHAIHYIAFVAKMMTEKEAIFLKLYLTYLLLKFVFIFFDSFCAFIS